MNSSLSFLFISLAMKTIDAQCIWIFLIKKTLLFPFCYRIFLAKTQLDYSLNCETCIYFLIALEWRFLFIVREGNYFQTNFLPKCHNFFWNGSADFHDLGTVRKILLISFWKKNAMSALCSIESLLTSAVTAIIVLT